MSGNIPAPRASRAWPGRLLSDAFGLGPGARARFLCLLVVLIAFGMRVYRLGDVSLGGDEGFTYTLASRDYSGLLSEIIRLGEPQPAGSYLLEKAWLDLGGRSEFNLRMLNVGFGVVAVALAFALALKLTRSRPAAIVAAILVATNPFGLHHSREYRTYAMLACLALACLAALLAYARAPSKITFFALVACEWAVIQAHYVAGFLVAALSLAVMVWWLAARLPSLRLSWPRPPRLGGWVLAQLVVAGLTLPWLILASGTANTYPGTGSGNLSLGAVAGAELALFTGADVLTEIAPGLMLLGALAFLAGGNAMWRSSGQGKSGLLTLCICIAAPLLAVWAVSWVKPVFHPRYLIVVWPLFALVASAGAGARGRALRIVAVCAALAFALASIAGGIRYLSTLNFSNQWRPLVTAFKTRTGDLPASVIQLTIPWPDPSFGYYYEGDNVTVLPGADRSQPGVSAQLQGFADKRIRRVLTHSSADSWWDVTNLALRFDPAPYSRVETFHFEQKRFDVYERVFGDHLAPLDAVFVNGIRLRGIEILTDTHSSALGLELAFDGPAQLRGTEKSFIHLIDPAEPGRIVAQVDSPLLAGHLTAPGVLRGMPLPANLPRRAYEIWFGVYDPTLPGEQRIPTTSGTDRALLGKVILGR